MFGSDGETAAVEVEGVTAFALGVCGDSDFVFAASEGFEEPACGASESTATSAFGDTSTSATSAAFLSAAPFEGWLPSRVASTDERGASTVRAAPAACGVTGSCASSTCTAPSEDGSSTVGGKPPAEASTALGSSSVVDSISVVG